MFNKSFSVIISDKIKSYKKNIKVDSSSFEKEMKKSKALARANWKGSGDKSVEERWFKIREELEPTEFLGYEFDKAEGVVIKMLKNNEFVQSASEGEEIQIITNQTILRKKYEGFGEVRQAKPPAQFENTPSEIARPAPKLGEHAEEILSSIGISKDDQKKLVQEKKIFISD